MTPPLGRGGDPTRTKLRAKNSPSKKKRSRECYFFVFLGWNHRFWCRFRDQRNNLLLKTFFMSHFSYVKAFFCADSHIQNSRGNCWPAILSEWGHLLFLCSSSIKNFTKSVIFLGDFQTSMVKKAKTSSWNPPPLSLELSSKSPNFTEFFKPRHSTSLKENAKTKTSTLDLTHFVQFFPNLVTFTFTRYRVTNLTCRIPASECTKCNATIHTKCQSSTSMD